MIVYTSITKSYLPKARVLAATLKQQHPDWKFHVLFSDTLPAGFDLNAEPFDVIWTIDQLGIPNWKAWSFGHDVVELCTAVKGPAGLMFAKGEVDDKIIYLDPDIRVYSSLQTISDLLDYHDVLLTPHLLHFESEKGAVIDNEITSLQHGTYNLGFFAASAKGQGRAFLEWWAARLLDHCIADIPRGLFTDQRWVDLAPSFFDRLHIIRDPGCNVATWNIHHRRISKSDTGEYLAGGTPLKFYHFTGYDSGDGRGVLLKYAADQPLAIDLWDNYAGDLARAGVGDPALSHFAYGMFANGAPIDKEIRRLYRARSDLQEAFPDPYAVSDWSLYTWWMAEKESRAAKLRTSDPPVQAPRLVKRVLGRLSQS